MNFNIHSPELAYLSPTTRERAIVIAQQMILHQRVSPKEAIREAINVAKNWAVKSVNRQVWKRLKKADREAI
ncbi:hypothetical protein GCM10027275_14050 [Rhabdobacter roseus]|uniref:Uncharacterized protein n=1 Tax=Rhabdobacter roseus TaxID=1655419 RepID=A0A840TIP1_9BACT|nr:hypothetical protein [Rhabdobacter roseus]MBB5283324.1 hypothetical protein [Rhabdobacter roseus]